MVASQSKLYRFYRSNLSTIVWDSEFGKVLAEFVSGQFYTEDARVAGILKELGYPEVPLDATEPPDIFFKKGKSLEEGENVQVMGKSVDEGTALAREQAELQQKALAEKAKAQTMGEDQVEDHSDKSPGQIALDKAGAEQEAKTKPPVRKPTAKKKTPTTAPVDSAKSIAKKAVKSKPKAKPKAKKRAIKRRKK